MFDIDTEVIGSEYFRTFVGDVIIDNGFPIINPVGNHSTPVITDEWTLDDAFYLTPTFRSENFLLQYFEDFIAREEQRQKSRSEYCGSRDENSDVYCDSRTSSEDTSMNETDFENASDFNDDSQSSCCDSDTSSVHSICRNEGFDVCVCNVPGPDRGPPKIRGAFTPAKTAILTDWFLDNRSNPYPTIQQKTTLATDLGLTLGQVCDWFTNKRKRHWTPVMKKKIRSPKDKFERQLVGGSRPRKAGRQVSKAKRSLTKGKARAPPKVKEPITTLIPIEPESESTRLERESRELALFNVASFLNDDLFDEKPRKRKFTNEVDEVDDCFQRCNLDHKEQISKRLKSDDDAYLAKHLSGCVINDDYEELDIEALFDAEVEKFFKEQSALHLFDDL